MMRTPHQTEPDVEGRSTVQVPAKRKTPARPINLPSIARPPAMPR